jgi:hypothetical protein
METDIYLVFKLLHIVNQKLKVNSSVSQSNTQSNNHSKCQ